MSRKDNAGILGLGAAACAACCAGPLLAFLGGAAAISVGVAVLVGSIALAAAGAGLLAVVAWRRKRRAACDVPDSVAVAAPTRREATAAEGPAAERTSEASDTAQVRET